MFQLLEKLLARAGYVRAVSIVIPAPEVKYVTGQHSILSNGKHIFPTSTDSHGNPIHFERGISYIVGSNGRWRKRRVVKAKSEADASSAEDGAADEVVEADNEPTPASSRLDPTKQHSTRSLYDPVHNRSIYQAWLKLYAACHKPNSKPYKAAGPNGAQMVASWMEYDNFHRDVVDLPSRMPYRQLLRIDNGQPFGPGNVVFGSSTSLEAGYTPTNRSLTPLQVAHIRNSPANRKQLANQYGISTNAITNIRSRVTYRDVE